MNFRFQCWVQRHASGRVTLTPLTLPHLAVHGDTLEKATEELTLALDDQLTRIHPRRVPEFIAAAGGTLHTLEVPGLPVWGASENTSTPLPLTAVVAPAHQAYTGLHAPRLDTHLWFQGKHLPEEVVTRLGEQLEGLSDSRLLALRPDGAESLLEVEVQATPSALAALTPRQLNLDIRPPPRPPEAPTEKDEAGDDDDGEDALDLDTWEPRRRKRPRDFGAKPAKPPPTPTLEKLGVSWHKLAQEDELDPAYEQDALVSLLRSRLGAKDAEALVLVGPAGVGKTAVLHALAQALRAPGATEAEKARPFFFLDGSRLIAGEGMWGDWQQQVLRAFREAAEAHALLSLGHVVDLLDAGKSAHSDQNVAQLLLPLMATREVSVVAEATPETWAQVERRNTSFARLFSVIRVEEPTPEALANILKHVAADEVGPTPLKVRPDALDEVRFLCKRFLPYGAQVGNAVGFLRRLMAACAHAAQERVNRLDAVRQFASESGIPESLLRDDLPLDAATVRAFLAARVMGQEAAVERVSAVVSVLKAGLSDTRRPLGVLFFVGPTGVGKTELSKALAELLFGSRERMVRLDMGEYAGPDALLRLLGDGERAGHLSSAVRRQPFCVVLLDEVEKAHPAVHDALLGVLGEGRLTDASGRFTDFRNAVLILTSNLGADTWRARVGFSSTGEGPDPAALRAHYLAEVQRFFRPELFNRLDDVVVFSPLSAELLRRLVVREVDAVCRRPGLTRHDAQLVVAPSALDWLAERGFDARYGARPLKRALERELVVPVAAWLAAHPNAGPVRLHAEATGAGLELRSESVGGDAEGVGRQAIERVLEEAATLRAEVQRWSRSPPMTALRRELIVFDKSSRLPAFWEERGLAEESARKAAEARELDKAFRECVQQTEAVEDLLFEAHLSRSVGQAEALGRDVAALRKAFLPLRERVFTSLSPVFRGVTLLLMPGRGAWGTTMMVLANAYMEWARSQSIAIQRAVLGWPELKSGEKPPRKPPPPRWRLAETTYLPDLQPVPVALALQFTSNPSALLLSGEHGLHRFFEGSQSSAVRVRYEPRLLHLSLLPELEQLERDMPKDDIRRMRTDAGGAHGGVLEDLRTGLKHRYGAEGPSMEAVLEAWLHWRVFGAPEEG